MKLEVKPLRVKEGRTELTVDHNGEDLTFIHPAYGPDTYSRVRELIEEANEDKTEERKLKGPTMAQTASLVYTAFHSEECDDKKVRKYSKEIKEKMKKNWLWTFTGILYVPKEGAFIQDDPDIRNKKPFMDKSDLVRRLEQRDPSVRFVPFGFKTGEQTSRDLEKNEFVKCMAGEEGAEKLAEVASQFRLNPRLYVPTVDKETTRVSGLYSYRVLDDRLGVDGDGGGDDDGGFVFGYVPKNSPQETKARKK